MHRLQNHLIKQLNHSESQGRLNMPSFQRELEKKVKKKTEYDYKYEIALIN